MPWFWLSPLFGALVVAAYCAMPVWFVLRHRDGAPSGDAVPQPRLLALVAASNAAHPVTPAPAERDAA